MTRASISRRTTTATNASAALEIIGGPRGCWLRELSLTLVAATASVYGLGKPAAIGVAPTSPAFFLMEASSSRVGSDGSVQSTTAIAWTTTAPTVPTAFFRQESLAAAIGSRLSWLFGSLFIPTGSTLVLWNGAANSLADVNVVIDEPS